MVARGAGAAGSVLLACRQWDPLGLARRLPSLGVGAWRCAPLLPWRVQCPVCVCAALAAGSGGSGRYLVLCLSRVPLPAPRVPRCVWRAVPSGCPLPSLAGTPFHAVCAFRALGPVALLVVPACPFRVCALALPRRPLPPPLGGVAWAPRVVPALGAGRAVPRGPVPCSVWRARGCAVRSRFPPTWLGVVGVAVGRPQGGCLLLLRGASGVRRSPSPDCPPTGRAVGVRDSRVGGTGVRVWRPFSVPSACTPCGGCAPRGGSVAFVCRGAGWEGGGGGSLCLVPSLCLPPPWCAPLSSPGRPLIRPLCSRRPGRRRSAVGRRQAGRVSACLGRGAPAPRVQRPLRGGCGAAISSVWLCPLLGLSGRGGGEWGGPSGPLATPPDGRGGGAAWRSRPRGPAIGWGVAPFPRPPLPRAGPWCRPSLGPTSPRPSSRGAGRPGAAVRVSGQRLAGCGPADSPPSSLSPPSLPREVARSPASCRPGGGAWVGGPSSPPHFLATAVWAVTCAAACLGAGAVAAAGCAGGSASGRGRCAKPGGASCWRPNP